MYQRTRIKLAKQTVEARQQVRRRPMQNIGGKGEGTEQPTGLPQDGEVRSADRELRAKAATSGCVGAVEQGGRGRSADSGTWVRRLRRGEGHHA
jgi:hypothetical protein